MSSSGRPVTLRITEIFHSLQGETSRSGLPTVFVRLTGCPLRCSWCDTEYSFTGGTTRTLDDVLAEIASYGCQTVCVTGGEPLAQKPCLNLLTALCDAGYSVSLETSGALDISGVDSRVSRIVDLKAPGSGEVERNLLSNIPLLTLHDELKLVLASEADYEWAKAPDRRVWPDRALPGPSCPGARPAETSRSRRMDPARPPSGTHAGATAQDHLGQRARTLNRHRHGFAPLTTGRRYHFPTCPETP